MLRDFYIYSYILVLCRPTNRPCERVRNGKFDVGIADDQVQRSVRVQDKHWCSIFQARDFDFVAAEMKYDSTGMFHWTPSRPIEDCIQVSRNTNNNPPLIIYWSPLNICLCRTVTRPPWLFLMAMLWSAFSLTPTPPWSGWGTWWCRSAPPTSTITSSNTSSSSGAWSTSGGSGKLCRTSPRSQYFMLV